MNVTQQEFEFMCHGMNCDLVALLMEREGMSMPEAFLVLYNSDTYKAYHNPQTKLFYQAPGYVYSYLENELKYGKMG